MDGKLYYTCGLRFSQDNNQMFFFEVKADKWNNDLKFGALKPFVMKRPFSKPFLIKGQHWKSVS